MSSETYDCIFKVLLLGDSGVGKSSTILRYVDEDFKEQHHCTIGVEFGSKIIHYQDRSIDRRFPGFESKKFKLQVWDTAGQERFRSVTKSYFRGTSGVIMVFDITNRESFNNLQYWLQELEQVRGSCIDTSQLEESEFQEDPKITYSEVQEEDSTSNMQEIKIDKSYVNSGTDSGTKTNNNYTNIDSDEASVSYSFSDIEENNDSDDLTEFPGESCSESSSDDNETVENTNKNNCGIQVQRYLDPVEFLHVRYPPIILVGNKVDLSKEDREIYADEAIQFAKKNYFDYYIETSALTGNHVEEVFNNLAKTIYLNVKRRGTGLNGVISPKHRNPTWYELEAYKRRNGCSC